MSPPPVLLEMIPILPHAPASSTQGMLRRVQANNSSRRMNEPVLTIGLHDFLTLLHQTPKKWNNRWIDMCKNICADHMAMHSQIYCRVRLLTLCADVLTYHTYCPGSCPLVVSRGSRFGEALMSAWEDCWPEPWTAFLVSCPLLLEGVISPGVLMEELLMWGRLY